MLLKTRKFCLDKITKIKKLLTFKQKEVPIKEVAKKSVTYAEFLKLKNKRIRAKAISKSEFQLLLNNILEEYDVGISRWFKVCDLFFQHPTSYVDGRYNKAKKMLTKKSIFRKKDCGVSEPFIIDYEKPKITEDEKQERIKQFLEDLYDKDLRSRRNFADSAADDMIAVTKTDEIAFVGAWDKYLKRTKKEPNPDSFKTFLVNNQKFTRAQLNKFQVSATFVGNDLINYGDFKEEMERVKSL